VPCLRRIQQAAHQRQIRRYVMNVWMPAIQIFTLRNSG
jgi:hypothetical protein